MIGRVLEKELLTSKNETKKEKHPLLCLDRRPGTAPATVLQPENKARPLVMWNNTLTFDYASSVRFSGPATKNIYYNDASTISPILGFPHTVIHTHEVYLHIITKS